MAAKRRARIETATAGDLAAVIAMSKLEALEQCKDEVQKIGVELMASKIKIMMEEIWDLKLPEVQAKRDNSAT